MHFVRSRHRRWWQGKRQYSPQTASQLRLSFGCVLKFLLCALTPMTREDPTCNFSGSRNLGGNGRPINSNGKNTSTASTKHGSCTSRMGGGNVKGENSREAISKSKQLQSLPPKPKMTKDIQCMHSACLVHDNPVQSSSPEDKFCVTPGQTQNTATSPNMASMNCSQDGCNIEDKEKYLTVKKKINSVFSCHTLVKYGNEDIIEKPDDRKEKVEKVENEWEILFERSQKKLKKEISQKRETKYKMKADLEEEKCALDLAEQEIKEVTEAIKKKEEIRANMKNSCISIQLQEDLLYKLDKKYHIAKSKLYLSHLEEQLCKLERDTEKRRQKIAMLSHQVHRLAFSIPLVAEAGLLDQDEERIILPEQPTPSIFLSKNTSDGEASSGIISKNIPICWTTPRNISSCYIQVPPS